MYIARISYGGAWRSWDLAPCLSPGTHTHAQAHDTRTHMTTPSMAFSMCVRNATVAFGFLWMLALMLTRLYALHEEYVKELGIRDDERWLVEKCKDPEFYANLRQHSDLCTKVSNNAHASIALRVMSRVLERSTHLCGDTSCGDVVASIAARFGWHAVALIAITMVLAPNLLMVMMRGVMRRRMLQRMEEDAMSVMMPCHAAGGPPSVHALHYSYGGGGAGMPAPLFRSYGGGAFNHGPYTQQQHGDKAFPMTSASACRRMDFFHRPIQYIGNGFVGSSMTIKDTDRGRGGEGQGDSDDEEEYKQRDEEQEDENYALGATRGSMMGFGGGVARLI